MLALESLGRYLHLQDDRPQNLNLGQYQRKLSQIAQRGSQVEPEGASPNRLHLTFEELFWRVKSARNEFVHQGAHARLAVVHAVHLCLLIEDGLMAGSTQIGDYIVREPVCAALWHPLSYVRQLLLSNSYSSLPVHREGEWKLVRDLELAIFIRNRQSASLQMSLEKAVSECAFELLSPYVCGPNELVTSALNQSRGLPVIVVESSNRLLGLATPFDLL